MATMTRDELLTVTLKEFGKLEALIAGLSDGQALVTDDDGISIKDTIGHRAHWIELFFGWYQDGQAGKQVAFPATGYKWSQLKAYNAVLRQSQAGLSWDAVMRYLADNHARLIAFITGRSDAELYGGPMQGANNDWPPGRWAEAAGPSHYRSAAKYIRQILKQRQG